MRGLRVNRKVFTQPDLDHANVGKYCSDIAANIPNGYVCGFFVLGG